jgi:hypothetical protein
MPATSIRPHLRHTCTSTYPHSHLHQYIPTLTPAPVHTHTHPPDPPTPPHPPQVDDPGSSVVVLAQLQDTYQKFQLDLSTKLAREHPELSEQLCEEMMTRQLAGVDKVGVRGSWMTG